MNSAKSAVKARYPKPTIDTLWFKTKLEASGISQAALARHLDNLDRALMTRLLNGQRRMQTHEAIKIAEVLNEPLEEVLARAGVVGERQIKAVGSSDMVDLVGWVDGGMKVVWEAPKGLKNRVPAPATGPTKNLSAVRLHTLGSAFAGMDGGLLYFREAGKAEGVDVGLVGRLVLVKVRGNGEWFFGVLGRGYSVGTYNVGLLNGQLLLESVVLEKALPVEWMKF